MATWAHFGGKATVIINTNILSRFVCYQKAILAFWAVGRSIPAIGIIAARIE